ncbi:glycosyltransferase family 4 protein [Nodularia harveyana UHCC-0300]|uniref:Glycosyltransferase family 4 protein n=1 Tax=Nodularia harveyana UHCC-0300 TaxID=2974287 RepID=A0ABU5UD27_9CYAN|nr:glycosyltransferase family 4 protein [Nodularia harveyana]MEA5581049.1 glycosyltransferase family 4 protein [Nodularia harveyana UHCC-0300]
MKDQSLTQKFVFISSCCEPWGGSEELWFESAKYLKNLGYVVTAYKNGVNTNTRFKQLKADGIKVKDIKYLVQLLRKLDFLLVSNHPVLSLFIVFNKYILKYLQASLVVISQGENFDGVEIAKLCLRLNLPYVIISQKASDAVWKHGITHKLMQDVYVQAKYCFFVSKHNLSLTEAQIGYHLPNAEVIRNPHRAIIQEALPYPKLENDCCKLACVGRFWILDKGQDILLRVLAQDKWQNRHLHISFFGQGVDRDALMDMAKLLGIKNVSFPGFVENILDIWHHHHALIMPSRAEGLPIALVEAMMCGRPAIVTDVGGISEVLEDNITGFIAQGAFFAAIDEALERAWQRRYEWEYIGKEASISIREIIPPHPEQIFADKLVQLSTLEVNSAPIGDRT